jgi:hypothetical protein
MSKNLRVLLFGAGAAAVVLFIIRRQAAAALNAINPLNNDNVIAGTVDDITGASDRGSSLGSDIFDFFERLRGRAPFDPNEFSTTQPIIMTDKSTSAPLGSGLF